MGAIRKDRPPNPVQRQIILASLLGDGSLSKPPIGINYHFSLYHSAKQKEYLEWKHNLLQPFSRPIQHCFSLDKRDGKIREGFRFHTISIPYFTKIRKLTYDGRRKTITADWLSQVHHPLALAILIGDDGSALNTSKGKACGLNIATKQFSQAENELIAFWLQSTYGLKTAKVRRAPYPYISIGVADVALIRQLVRPYLPESMWYKIGGKEWEPNPRWVGKIKIECLSCGKPIEIYASSNKRYCSWQCSGIAKRGKSPAPKTEAGLQRIRDWWVAHREENSLKIREAKRMKLSGVARS